MAISPIHPTQSLKRKREQMTGSQISITDRIATNLPPRKIIRVMGSANNKTATSPAVDPQQTLQSLLSKCGQQSQTFSYQTVPQLFESLPTTNQNDWCMEILGALRNGDLEALRQFHQEGRNVQCQNKFGETLLHVACRKGMISIVQFLLEEVQMPLNIHDDTGRTPLHDAFWTPRPNEALMDVLLSQKSAMDLMFVQDKRGHCPLQYARKADGNTWNRYLTSRAQVLTKTNQLNVVSQ